MPDTSKLMEKIGREFGERAKLSEDGQIISVLKGDAIDLMKILIADFGFEMLADITAVEYEDRLEVVYHLMAMIDAQVIRIKVGTSKDNPSVPSTIPVWMAANVLERELYDLMGVNFEGHPELKRILCPEDFEGHPLRKDFKLEIIERFK